MRKSYLLISFAFCLLFPSKIYPWGTIGHRVIAEIAERNLDKKAEKEIKKILDNQYLAYWANWADFIKSDTTDRWTNTHVWHFVNAPANLSKSEYINAIRNVRQENLYSQIPKLEFIIANNNSTKDEKKEALIFLVHLIGDMHQPMHTGREEDRGGNRIMIQWFGQDTNLHSLWDSKLVDFEKYSYTEYATVLNVITPEEKKELQAGVLEDWLFDSHCMANEIYAITKPGDNLSFEYNYRVRPIVDKQLLKAGLRLAKILNELFG